MGRMRWWGCPSDAERRRGVAGAHLLPAHPYPFSHLFLYSLPPLSSHLHPPMPQVGQAYTGHTPYVHVGLWLRKRTRDFVESIAFRSYGHCNSICSRQVHNTFQKSPKITYLFLYRKAHFRVAKIAFYISDYTFYLCSLQKALRTVSKTTFPQFDNIACDRPVIWRKVQVQRP